MPTAVAVGPFAVAHLALPEYGPARRRRPAAAGDARTADPRVQQPGSRPGPASRTISHRAATRLCRASSGCPGRDRNSRRRTRDDWRYVADYDQPVHRLQAPSRADELARQPVEQFGMRGLLAWCRNRSVATSPRPKYSLPDAVDRHSRRQRINRIHEPTGQVQPVGALARSQASGAGPRGARAGPLRPVAGSRRTDQQVRRSRLRPFAPSLRRDDLRGQSELFL